MRYLLSRVIPASAGWAAERKSFWAISARVGGPSPVVGLVVRHVIIFGHGHGLQRAIIDESQHRAPERLIMAQH